MEASQITDKCLIMPTNVEETTLCIYVNNIVVACIDVKDHFTVNINNI